MKCFVEWYFGDGYLADTSEYKTIAEARQVLAITNINGGDENFVVAVVKNLKGKTVDTAVKTQSGRYIYSRERVGKRPILVQTNGIWTKTDPKAWFLGFGIREGTPGMGEVMLFPRGAMVLTAKGKHWNTFD